MIFKRHDLLDLTIDAMIALSNAGFVKKAQKEIELGHLPHIEEDEAGKIRACYSDGVETELLPGRTLRDASCTCPASGLCRHRVMLVLSYQKKAEEAKSEAKAPASSVDGATADTETGRETAGQPALWSPADFDDAALASSLSSLTLREASRLAAASPIITLEYAADEQQAPLARLPMCSVRFFSKASLAYARCDCKAGGACAHVALAIWAFRQSREERLNRDLNGSTHTLILRRAEASVLVFDNAQAKKLKAAILDWIQWLWEEGTAHVEMILDARQKPLEKGCKELGWAWVQESLQGISDDIRAQAARSSRFDPERLLMRLAFLWARLHAAEYADPPERAVDVDVPTPQILGMGVKGEVPLDHVRLVSLGLQLWGEEVTPHLTEASAVSQALNKRIGVNVVFADTDTQTLMVFSRDWTLPIDSGTQAENPWAICREELLRRRVVGQPMKSFGSSQVVTKTAIRRANGAVDLSGLARHSNFFPLSPKAWDTLVPPIRQLSVAGLMRTLKEKPPQFLQPEQAIGQFYVFYPEDGILVHAVGWDAAAQCLYADVSSALQDDASIEPLRLVLLHQALAPDAISAAAAVLLGDQARFKAVSGEVRRSEGRLVLHPWALATEEALIVLHTTGAETPEPVLPPWGAARAPIHEECRQLLDFLTHCLRLGLRYQARTSVERLRVFEKRFEDLGLLASLDLLQRIRQDFERGLSPPRCSEIVPLILLLCEMGLF